MRKLLLTLLAALPAWLGAATFDLQAQISGDQLELGESLRLRIVAQLEGQMVFPPQLDAPSFDGFEVRGPQETNANVNINGVAQFVRVWDYELTAVKAGTLKLGPFVARGKDALKGEVVKRSQAFEIKVKRPKDLGLKALAPTPTPVVDEAELVLHDIKPDKGFPWQPWALGLGGGLALLALLLTLWRRRPPKPAGPPPPRDPAQWALERLEKLRQERAEGEDAAFVVSAAALLRDYLRHRLELRHEATLTEGLRQLRQRAPGADDLRETGLRLDRLLYADVPVEPADADWAYESLRALIIQAEQRLPKPGAPTPAPKRNPKKRGSHGQ